MAEATETSATDISPYLKQVRVRDYPPLRDAKVDFKPGLNIIIGDNGSGKTRFISLTQELADLYNDANYLRGTNHSLVFGGLFGDDRDTNVKFSELLGDEPLERKIQMPQKVSYSEAPNKETLKLLFSNKFHKPFQCILINYNVPTLALPIIDENIEITVEKRSFDISSRNGIKRLDEIDIRFVKALLKDIRSVIRYNPPLPNGENIEELIHEDILRTVDFYLRQLNYLLPSHSPIQEVQCTRSFQVYYDSILNQYKIKGLVLENLFRKSKAGQFYVGGAR